ncbi:MAG: UvrB/UvrC motif-containing protein [Bacteroidia bacterium]|nr:UvrB/UvrC motif-containing protein [Bacteroidia bacterium]
MNDSKILIIDKYNDYKFILTIDDSVIELKLEKEKYRDEIKIIKYLQSLIEKNCLSLTLLPNKVQINNQFIYETEILYNQNDFFILENKFEDGTINQTINFDEFSIEVRKKVEVLVWAYKILENIKKLINMKYHDIYYHSIEYFLKKKDDYYSIFISFLSEKEKKINFLQEQLEKYIDTENFEEAHKIKIEIDKLKKTQFIHETG